jgi:hypothetical protein
MNKKYTMSIDAETSGLWGQPFAIAATVYDEQGNIFDLFLGRLPDSYVTNEWVRDNVLPTLFEMEVTHEVPFDLYKDFSDFYLKYKDESNIICHMGYIVESYLFRIIKNFGLIGEWDAPYPLYDISAMLHLKGEDDTSVDTYITKYQLQLGKYAEAYSTHNPLYDCEVSFRVYEHLMKNK